MSQRKAKSKTKLGEIIRTDVWDLSASPEQKRLMVLTIEEYRRYLKALVLIVNAQWLKLAELTTKERVNAIEKSIHQTAKNPEPKHHYFQSVVQKYPSFRKFPSYLRRAGIADTIGIVSSFQTRVSSSKFGSENN